MRASPTEQPSADGPSDGGAEPDPDAGGTTIEDGAFEGQGVVWDGSAWVPLPGAATLRVDTLATVDASPSTLQLGFGSANLVGTRAQINDALANTVVAAEADRWQASYADGETTTQISGDATTIALTATDAGGTILLSSHGARQTMADHWQVSVGAGEDRFVANDALIGFLVQVQAGQTVTLQNASGCVYQIQDEIHVFRTPDAGGAAVDNLLLSHDGNSPTVGFLGAGPVARQNITGATTQEQVDSLIAALVALGLASDGR